MYFIDQQIDTIKKKSGQEFHKREKHRNIELHQ